MQTGSECFPHPQLVVSVMVCVANGKRQCSAWLAHTVAQSARLSAEKESGEIIMQRATMLLAPLGALLKRSERVHSRTKGRVLENFRKFRLSKLCSAAIVVIGVNFTYYMGDGAEYESFALEVGSAIVTITRADESNAVCSQWPREW